ncbi:MAG: sugar phosphate isomerase/epimerase [Deltaproteobacteria bacterium]|nr:sugar phosphate isomerase/epimerase [Deltaproteobacteria bacterium]
MKFAFSTNAFRGHSLVDTIETLAGLGYEGIEIMADTPHAYPPDMTDEYLDSVRETLQRCGMRVANINAFMLHAIGDTWHPSWIEPEKGRRMQRIRHTLDCIELAAALGAPTISTEPGGPLLGMTEEEGLLLFRQGLAVVHDLARSKNVRVLIEPEPGLLIENSSQFLEIYSGLDQDVFGLNFDIGHFFCVGEDPARLVKSLHHCTAHFHLEDIAESRVHHHLMPGQGAIDLPGVLRAIRQTGYAGFVTVELYPYEDRPVEAARQALDYLRRCGE